MDPSGIAFETALFGYQRYFGLHEFRGWRTSRGQCSPTLKYTGQFTLSKGRLALGRVQYFQTMCWAKWNQNCLILVLQKVYFYHFSPTIMANPELFAFNWKIVRVKFAWYRLLLSILQNKNWLSKNRKGSYHKNVMAVFIQGTRDCVCSR